MNIYYIIQYKVKEKNKGHKVITVQIKKLPAKGCKNSCGEKWLRQEHG